MGTDKGVLKVCATGTWFLHSYVIWFI